MIPFRPCYLLLLVVFFPCGGNALSTATTTTGSSGATNSIPVPTGKSYLPFQMHSIEALSNSSGILLADEMGLGKTISAIGAFNVLRPSNILIVSPKSVIPNWQWELNQWLVDHEEAWETTTITAEKGIPQDDEEITASKGLIWLINYDIVEKFRHSLNQVSWDVVVCDEAHFLKNPTAIRTQALIGEDHHSISARRWWFLTGSPILNNPSELYTLLKQIDPRGDIIPQLSGGHDTFAQHFSHARYAPWGTTYKGGRNLPELRQRLQQIRTDCQTPLMIRRTKAQVLPELPPKQHQMLPLWDQDKTVANGEFSRIQAALSEYMEKQQAPNGGNATPRPKTTVAELKAILKQHNLKVSGKKQELIDRLHENGIVIPTVNQEPENAEEVAEPPASPTIRSESIYHSAESALRSQNSQQGSKHLYSELMALLNHDNSTAADQDSIRGLLAQARHETARQKLPHAKELIREAISSHKVVVFAHHRDVQDELREAFADCAVGIKGGDSLEDRAEAVRRFQTEDSVRVFVGSIRAAGTGITLNAASHVIFVELDWSPLVVQQAEDRCHRVGQASSVLVQYLFFSDTIDEYLSQLLASKQSTIKAAIDEASGSAQWVFDFGKHEGLCVGDVAGSDPSYLEWLAKTKTLLAKRPDLAVALRDLGYVRLEDSIGHQGDDKEETEASERKSTPFNDVEENDFVPKRLGIRATPGSYVMTFGKHKGKSLADIPIGYLHWLRSSGATRRNPTMAICINKHLAERRR